MVKQLKPNIPSLLLSKIYVIMGNDCCFTDCIKKTLTLASIQTFMNWFSQTWYDDRNYWTLHFDTSLWLKVMEIEESKNFCASYLQISQMDLDGIWHVVETCWPNERWDVACRWDLLALWKIGCGMLLRLVGLMKDEMWHVVETCWPYER